MTKLKKLKTILKYRIKEEVVAGNFSAVNPGAIAGLHPPDTHPKQVMSILYRRKKKLSRRK